MRAAFLSFIKDRLELAQTDSLLLAVSGGVDSVVMLDLFHAAGFNVAVAHCNFGLRAWASDADQELVEGLCQEKHIPCFVERFDAEKQARNAGISIQMAARLQRYTWFEELRVQHGFDYIATAHHLDDSFETVILNLVRGTGLRGLKGISARKDFLLRPMLFATQKDILDFAQKNKLRWREDASNATTKYKRNFVRHEIVPKCKSLNGSLLDTFKNTVQRLEWDAEFIENQKDLFCKSWMQSENGVKNITIVSWKTAARAITARILSDFDFDAPTIAKIMASELDKPGVIFKSKSYDLVVDREHLYFFKKESFADVYIEIHSEDKLIETPYGNLEFNPQFVYPIEEELKNPYLLFLDAEKLKFPLILRNWKPGDRFKPFGMNGSKLVSDYIVDKKMTADQKRKLLVLCAENEIVWLVSWRAAQYCNIHTQTWSILRIEAKF